VKEELPRISEIARIKRIRGIRDISGQFVVDGRINRRQMVQMLASLAAGITCAPLGAAAESGRVQKRLGIGMHSYGFHWQAARNGNPNAKFSTALEFLEYCHKLGAGGVQVAVPSKEQGDAKAIRAKAESYQMYFEGQLAMPKADFDIARFEAELRAAKEAGATVVRSVLLGGRRYETFRSLEAFKQFHENAWKSLLLAEPVQIGRASCRERV